MEVTPDKQFYTGLFEPPLPRQSVVGAIVDASSELKLPTPLLKGQKQGRATLRLIEGVVFPASTLSSKSHQVRRDQIRAFHALLAQKIGYEDPGDKIYTNDTTLE